MTTHPDWLVWPSRATATSFHRRRFFLFGFHVFFALLVCVEGKYQFEPKNNIIEESSELFPSTDTTMRNPHETPTKRKRDRVCIVGSGNWGSAIACLIGRNCAKREEYFEHQVNMWVYEETIDIIPHGPQKLTDYINSHHENIKYLPGIQLPKNVVAMADLQEACKDATLLIFVLPHQFLPKLLPIIRKNAHSSCRGVSLIKGLGKQGGSTPWMWKLGVYAMTKALLLKTAIFVCP